MNSQFAPFTIRIAACQAGEILPLAPVGRSMASFHGYFGQNPPNLSVGCKIGVMAHGNFNAKFMVTGKIWLPGQPAARALQLLALTDLEANEECACQAVKDGYAIACITLSDKGSIGQREDKAGPLMAALLKRALPCAFVQNYLLPDDKFALRGLLADLALVQGYDLICTSGGTGLGPRDITPQVTESLLDSHLPGFSQAMMAASLAKTPRAVISRAVAGIIGNCLVLNLPGSVKAVAENLEPVLPALDHALDKLRGDPADCGENNG